MFKCKNCGIEMKRIYSFEGENYQNMQCPNCGASTKKRPIVYDEKGNLVTYFKKNNNKKKEKMLKQNDY